MSGRIRVTVVSRWTAGREIDTVMFHNKIYLPHPGCLWPSIALTVQNRGLKHHSFVASSALHDVNTQETRGQKALYRIMHWT